MTAGHLTAAIFLGLASFLVAFLFGIGTQNIGFAAVMALASGTAAVVLSARAPSGRQAWGRGFLVLAGTFLLMPGMLASALGQEVSFDTVEALMSDEGAMGRAVVTSALLGAGMLFGLFFGAIALVIGLILNRAPKAPYRPPAPEV